MLHVSMVGHAFAEVDATLITIDDAALVCWSAAGRSRWPATGSNRC